MDFDTDQEPEEDIEADIKISATLDCRELDMLLDTILFAFEADEDRAKGPLEGGDLMRGGALRGMAMRITRTGQAVNLLFGHNKMAFAVMAHAALLAGRLQRMADEFEARTNKVEDATTR